MSRGYPTHHSPFGSSLPSRAWSDVSRVYRYGFNGKEKDAEGMGGGSSTYDYGFRIYNPNLGKFLSVDPLTGSYPWYTPYQFAGNKPIWAIDIDGLEEKPVNNGPTSLQFQFYGNTSPVFNEHFKAALVILEKSTIFNNNKTQIFNTLKIQNIYIQQKIVDPNNPKTSKASSGVFNLEGGSKAGAIRLPDSDVNKMALSIAYESRNIVSNDKYNNVNSNVLILTKDEFVNNYFSIESEAQIEFFETAIELNLISESGQKNAIEQYKRLKAEKDFNKETYKKNLAETMKNDPDNVTLKNAYEAIYDKLKIEAENASKPKNESDTTQNGK